MYHPLDIVTLIDYSSGFKISVEVPVIFVKALASEAEWKDVNRNIRIGFDFLAIIVGLVIAFTTANPGALALALADIALATGDVAVQDAAKELEKTPEGREFLETWESIYMAGGVLLAGPFLIETIIVKGARLLTLVKTATSAKFLKTCLLKVLLEKEIINFTFKEIIYGEKALSSSGISFNFAGITRLQEQGVLFIKGIGFDDKVAGYVAIYKGEAIASGTAKEVREALKTLWTARGIKLSEGLERLYKLIPKLSEDRKFWTWENVMGTKLSKPYLSEKALLNKIKEIKAKNLPGIKGADDTALFEAEVGEEMFELGKKYSDKAIDFANKVNKSNVGEIDYSSYKYIVEAKINLNSFDALRKLQTQMKKYLHKFSETEINYLNIQNKTVVVVYKTGKIDKIKKESIEIIKQLEKDGVIFVNGIENLKKLY